MQQISSIKNWAEDDRPREKLLRKGRFALSDAELLAILIGSGTKSVSALDLAKMILSESGNNLGNLSRKSISDLKKYKGIGEARAITIFSAMELARRRSESEPVNKSKITSSADAHSIFKPYLTDLDHEEFYCIYLNRGNEVISCDQISKGGRNGTIADGKVIFQRALEHKCSAIILGHNHPSGQLKPSDQDKRLTRSLMEFGKHIDLQILDHLIVTDNNYFSFADQGILT